MYLLYLSSNKPLQLLACRRLARSAALILLAPAARSPHPEADAHQSRREGSRHLWNELQLGARRAVPRGFSQLCCARDAFARQRLRPARRLQSPTRRVTIHKECVLHEPLGHTARVFWRKRAGQESCQLAGGTEPQRQRVARGAARAYRRRRRDQLRAE